jgi:hypothetical protein
LAAGAIENGNRIALRRLQNELVRAGVLCPPAEKADPADSTVISLWLGHESTRSTQPYLHAHLAIKEVALAKIETVRPTEAFRCLGVAELRTAGHIPG